MATYRSLTAPQPSGNVLPLPSRQGFLRAGLFHHLKRRTSMSTTKSKTKTPAKPPELKIGPFQGGIGVAVWLNQIQTESGQKTIRSVTIAPRRYLDRQTGQWKDSGSF